MSDFPIVVRDISEPLTLYRACHGTEAADLERAMRSNYEARRPPHPAERRAIVTFMAVSMFEDGERLANFARQRPDRLGAYIAQVVLKPDLGICLADTGSRGHWSIWGLPHQLTACVVDVLSIDGA